MRKCKVKVLMCLDSIISNRLNPRHHLLLRDKMIDPLQQAQQTPHAPAPLIEHLIRISRLRKSDNSSGPVNLGIHRLRRHQRADITLRLVLFQIQQLRQTVHLDARVVLGHDADVVFDDALAEILPACLGLGVFGVFGGGEDVGGAEVGAEAVGDDGPAHDFGDGEGFEEFFFYGDEGVADVGVDAVEEVGLFVVVGGEEDVVDDSLEDLVLVR